MTDRCLTEPIDKVGSVLGRDGAVGWFRSFVSLRHACVTVETRLVADARPLTHGRDYPTRSAHRAQRRAASDRRQHDRDDHRVLGRAAEQRGGSVETRRSCGNDNNLHHKIGQLSYPSSRVQEPSWRPVRSDHSLPSPCVRRRTLDHRREPCRCGSGATRIASPTTVGSFVLGIVESLGPSARRESVLALRCNHRPCCPPHLPQELPSICSI